MGDAEREDSLLRQVPEPHRDPESLDDGLLLAYRAGRLSPEAAAEVEALLARNPEARALLRELTQPVEPGLAERVERASRGRPRWWIPAAMAAAAAAAFLIVAQDAPLPPYEMEARGFVASSRGLAAPSNVLEPDSRLSVTLRPEQAPEKAPALGVFVAPDGGLLERARAGRITSRSGVFRFEVEAAALFPKPGRYLVVLVLAPSEDVLQDVPGRRADGAKGARPWLEWWTVDVDYRSGEPRR